MYEALIEQQKRFINLRFGTFIHFNSATFQFNQGPIEDWEFTCENGGETRKYPFSPKDWNPVFLDCKGWAKAAKAAGCRFAALTAKHHEGFALWPSAYTDHSVKNGTVTTDVVAEYLEAFRSEGIEAGLYFSILDLTHGIGKRSCTEEQKIFIKNQIRELLTQYGSIPFLITDGWNAAGWGGPTYDMLPFEELDCFVKSIQPTCMLMNIGCSDGVNGTDIVFYENSAGQEAEENFCGPGVSCNKLTKTWFWRKTDPDSVLTPVRWVIEKAETYFPMNINLMLNLSPNTDGRIDQNLIERFEEIGKQLHMPAPIENIPAGWKMRAFPAK